MPMTASVRPPFAHGAVPKVPGALLLVETDRVRLRLPFQVLRAESHCVLGGVPEETGPDAAADPSGIDPEILQPGCLAFRDQRAPADRVAARVRDEADK